MRKDEVVSKVLGEELALTPSDLYNREFKHVLVGGYEPREVDEYLERVADVLESLINQVRVLRQQQEELRAKLEEYRQMEVTLRNALVTSQKFGENIIESAKREAETITDAAQVEKQRILAQAGQLPPALAEEITQLQELRNRLRADIQSIIATHHALLDGMQSAEKLLKVRPQAGPADAAHPGAEENDAPARAGPEEPAAFDQFPPADEGDDETPMEVAP